MSAMFAQGHSWALIQKMSSHGRPHEPYERLLDKTAWALLWVPMSVASTHERPHERSQQSP